MSGLLIHGWRQGRRHGRRRAPLRRPAVLRLLSRALPLAAILLCGAGNPSANAGPRSEDWNWLPIAPADLTLKDNPHSPGSAAMILYRELDIDEAKGTRREYERIKIFREAGRRYGDIQILYSKQGTEIRDIQARTILPDGRIVPFEGQIYESTIVKEKGLKVLAKTFTLPEVQPGAIVEYTYRAVNKRGYWVDTSWNVQLGMYTREARFSLRPAVPQQMGWRQYAFPYAARPERLSDGSFQLEIHDMPGVVEEEYTAPEEISRAHIDFFYRSWFDPRGKTTPEYWKFWSGTLDRASSEFLKKKKVLEAEASRLNAPGNSAEEKLKLIYARALQFHNTSFDPEKTEKELKREKEKDNKSVEDLVKRGTGSGWDIEQYFIGVARAAGFEANLVMVAGRDRSKFRPDFQDYHELTESLVSVKLPGGEMYLDPGARFYPFGLLPWWETDAKGIRANSQAEDLVSTPAPRASEAVLTRRVAASMDGEGNLSGTLEAEFGGRRGAGLRAAERDADKAEREKDVSEEIKGWLPAAAEVGQVSIENWEEIEAPLRVKAALRIPGYAAVAGRRLLAPITPFHMKLEHAFDSATRVNDIYFWYPWQEGDEIQIGVPEGYGVTAPAAAAPAQTDLGSYSLRVAAENPGVHVQRTFTLNGYLYSVLSYSALRDFIRAARNSDEGQLVIEQKKP